MIKTFIIVAHTADGFIAPASVGGQAVPSTVWTSGADKKKFIQLTKSAGVMVMGLNTFKTIGKPLKDRLNIVYAPKELAEKEKLNYPDSTNLEFTEKSPKDLLIDLENKGFKEVAICGGSTIYTMFMEAGLVDTIYITVEPHLFGAGMTIFNKPLNIKLELSSSEKLSDDVLFLEYKVIK
jgi:dihydrofolate reductase